MLHTKSGCLFSAPPFDFAFQYLASPENDVSTWHFLSHVHVPQHQGRLPVCHRFWRRRVQQRTDAAALRGHDRGGPCVLDVDPEGAHVVLTDRGRAACLWAYGLDLNPSEVGKTDIRAAHWPVKNETALFRGPWAPTAFPASWRRSPASSRRLSQCKQCLSLIHI